MPILLTPAMFATESQDCVLLTPSMITSKTQDCVLLTPSMIATKTQDCALLTPSTLSSSTKYRKPSVKVNELLKTMNVEMNVEIDDKITSLPDVFAKNTRRHTTLLRRRYIVNMMDKGILTWRMLLCGGIQYTCPNTLKTKKYSLTDWKYDIVECHKSVKKTIAPEDTPEECDLKNNGNGVQNLIKFWGGR